MHRAVSSLWEVTAAKGKDSDTWRAGFELAIDFQLGVTFR